MSFRIDNSSNDAPYQGIHIYEDDKHVLTFWEDDAPLNNFNSNQRLRARVLVDYLNSPINSASAASFNPVFIMECFQYVKFIKPNERIKLK